MPVHVTVSTNQSLSNKTLVNPKISLPLDFIQQDTPAPPVGYMSMYFKPDDRLYRQNSAGIEVEIGGNSNIQSLTSNWENTFTTVQANSASWGSGGGTSDTAVRSLTANWQNTFTTVQSNSASWGSDTYGEIWIGAGAMVPPALSSASATTLRLTGGGNEIYLDSFDFDPASTTYAQFNVSLPNAYIESSIKAKFSWTAQTTAGSIVWGIQGRIISDTYEIDGAWGPVVPCYDTVNGSTCFQMTSASSILTLSGNSGDNSMLLFRVLRSVNDALDTLAVNASLLGVKLQCEKGQLTAW